MAITSRDKRQATRDKMQTLKTNLKTELQRLCSNISFEEPLSHHTSLKIGGPAWAWIRVKDPEELVRILAFAEEASLPVATVGGGCNLLVSDAGFPGIVFNFRTPYFRRIEETHGILQVGAGVSNDDLLSFCRRRGWGGLEFMTGVPGSVGGSIFGNAGSHGKAIGDRVEALTLLDPSRHLIPLRRNELHFSYRNSNLNGNIVLGAALKVEEEPRELVEKRCQELMRYKKETQDFSHSNAGCIFKNPPAPHRPSGELIERSGLKGTRVGDAQVSPRHGNFIVNFGEATASDVYALIDQVRARVHKDHGVWLELEVREL